jgi:hypothetical protein
METSAHSTLDEIELRLSALESRVQNASQADTTDREEGNSPFAFLWVPVGIAPFAWLSGSMWAWIALACIGMACAALAGMLAVRQTR